MRCRVRCGGVVFCRVACVVVVYLYYSGGYATVGELVDWVRLVYAVEMYLGRRRRVRSRSIERNVRRVLAKLEESGVIERERFGRTVVVHLKKDVVVEDSTYVRKHLKRLVNDTIWKWFLPNLGRKKHERPRYEFRDLMKRLLDLHIHTGSLSIRSYNTRDIYGCHIFGAVYRLCNDEKGDKDASCGHFIITFEKYDPIRIRRVINYLKRNKLLNKCAVVVCEPFNLKKRPYKGFHIHVVFSLKCIEDLSKASVRKNIKRIKRELEALGVSKILPRTRMFSKVRSVKKMGLYLTKFFVLNSRERWLQVLGGIKLALNFSPQDIFIVDEDLIQWAEKKRVYLRNIFQNQ